MRFSTSRSSAFAIAVVLASSCLGGAPGLAQDAETDGSPPTEADSEDVIVVTARRLDERLEDVPVATSVLTAQDQEQLVLDNMQDYLRATPGALIVNAGPDYFNDISIRGQGGGRNGFRNLQPGSTVTASISQVAVSEAGHSTGSIISTTSGSRCSADLRARFMVAARWAARSTS